MCLRTRLYIEHTLQKQCVASYYNTKNTDTYRDARGPGISDQPHGLLWNRDWYVNLLQCTCILNIRYHKKIRFAFNVLKMLNKKRFADHKGNE